MARLFLCAAQPLAGKTIVAIGVAAALRRRRVDVECVDASGGKADGEWLELASGRPCLRLDPYGEGQAAAIAAADQGGGLVLIEGASALHDGAELDGGDSSAALAKRLKTPVVLVLDANETTLGLAALARGAATFDPDVDVAGVILNAVGHGRDLAKLRAAIEQRAGLPVLGMLPCDEALALGGGFPADGWQTEALIAAAADAVSEGVDLDRLLAIAKTAPALEAAPAPTPMSREEPAPPAQLGEVYLVGAGPGDIELLTLRALRLMRRADVVLYDRLANSRVMDLLPARVERISVGKQPDRHELTQDEICALMAELALQGKRVLRLKGGDPFMFGRGGEEIEYLADRGIPFAVCPGITAAMGAASYAGIPLTHRDHAQACVFVTGYGKTGRVDLEWPELIRPNQTVVVYMALRNLEALTAEFISRGAPPGTPAAIVDNATRSHQRVIVGDLATLARRAREAQLKGPAIVIVGSVVTLRSKLTGHPPVLSHQPD